MNSYNFRVIFVVFSAVLYLLAFFLVPLKTKFLLKKTGKLVVPTRKKNIFLNILILIFSALLIFMVWLRDLGIFTDGVVCLVSVLGCAMSLNEISLNKFCGLYENGIIGNGRFLPLEKILALPLLKCSKEELENIDSRILVVSTEKNPSEQFIFSTEEEKNSVQNEILKLNPRLA